MTGNVTTELAQITMPTGEQIWVHVTADSSITDSWGGGKGKILGRLEKLDETIRGVVRSVGTSVARHAPARTEIEFGIEISGGTGSAFAVLANAHAAASVKVKMAWEKGQFPHADEVDEADKAEEADGNDGPDGERASGDGAVASADEPTQ